MVLAALLVGALGSAPDSHLAGQPASEAKTYNTTQKPSAPIRPPVTTAVGSYVYPYGCEHPKDAEQDNLCVERQSAHEAKRQADWARRSFYLGIVGTIFVILTLGATAIAAWAARNGAVAAQKAAEIAERALTDLERPYVFARIIEPGLSRSHDFDGTMEETLRVSSLKYTWRNYGRSPAIITEFYATAKSTDTGKMPEPIAAKDVKARKITFGQVILTDEPHEMGTGAAVNLLSDSTIRIGVLAKKTTIHFLGFVRYRDQIGNHHETGYCAYFNLDLGQFVMHGGEGYNYTKSQKA